MRPFLLVGLGLLVLPAARADVARRRSPVVDVVQKVGPAVVFIGTEQVVDRRMRGTPLEEFFFGDGRRPQRQTVQSLGSGVIIHSDPELKRRGFDGEPWARQVDRIVQALPEQVYLSFDIDGLDPTLCPHTGTPVPGGLSFPEATALVAEVVRSRRRIIGMDLNEVAPGPEGDEWDGNVGARLLYKMIGFALKSRRG